MQGLSLSCASTTKWTNSERQSLYVNSIPKFLLKFETLKIWNKAEEIQDSIIEKSTRLKRCLEAQHKSNHVTTTTPNIREPPSMSPPQSSPVPATVPSTSASRLLKLSLPTFSGNPLLWQTFWDSFEAAVHGNPNLTGVEKFDYLRAQLEGEAARTVGGFPLTNANYEQSISLLKTRFGKQQRIVNAHMQALLDLQAPTNTAVSL